MIFAIDPGPTRSAYVLLSEDGRPTASAKIPNEELLELVKLGLGCRALVIEWITVASIAGAEVYQTCRWIGRYEQASPLPVTLLPRMDVLYHFFGKRNVRSADQLIRRTMLDRFGGDGAKGTRAEPGPLYGISTDAWSALALAVAWSEAPR